MEKILISIVIAAVMRVLITLVANALRSRPKDVLAGDLPPSPFADDEETRAAAESSEGGCILLIGVVGLSLEIDGVAVNADRGEDTVAVLRVSPGRHSVLAIREGARFSLDVLVHPHEDMVREFASAAVGGYRDSFATGVWREPSEAECARVRGQKGHAAKIDYVNAVIQHPKRRALVADRIERALAHYATAAERILAGAELDDPAVMGALAELKPLLDGAGLTERRFLFLATSVRSVVELHAHEGDRAIGARLAKFALEVLPEEPKLLIVLAEIEAARGNSDAGRKLIARARARASPLVTANLNDEWVARADRVLAECDA
jgi:hypothetical protein